MIKQILTQIERKVEEESHQRKLD